MFTSGLPLVMVGLDVTHQALLTPDHLEALDGTADIAVRNYLGLLYTMRVQIPDHMIGAEHGNKQQGNETS